MAMPPIKQDILRALAAGPVDETTPALRERHGEQQLVRAMIELRNGDMAEGREKPDTPTLRYELRELTPLGAATLSRL